MSSAEDTTPLTASPSANGTASTEEFGVTPSPGGGSAVTSTTQATSPAEQTADEPAEGAVPEAKTKPLPKVNAVAHEVRVNVTGARPGSNPTERELFAESTTTVLVFEKGGVIRLVAAVAPGQLLFLTNEDSKREVVAQVVRKRAYRPTECYVELEFTEPAPKFWGMEFSAATALLPKDSKQLEAAALVASAETSEDDPAQAAPPPSAEEVLALKKEIEALRGQLNSLQTQATDPAQPAPAAASPDPTPAPAPEPWVATGAGKVETEIAPNWMPAPQAPSQSADFEPAALPQAASSPSPSQELAAATQSAFKSLPREPAPRHAAMPPAQPQMPPPQPAFDFSASLPKKRKRAFRAKGNFTPGFRAGVLRLIFLSTALIVTIIGAAWYKHWLPWKPAEKAKKIEVATYDSSVAAPLPNAGATASNTTEPVGNGKPDAAAASNEAPLKPTQNGANSDSVAEGVHIVEPPKPDVVQPSGHGKTVPTASVGKRSPARPGATGQAGPTLVVSADPIIVVPPKLVKSARAVASLDDLRDFETGAVVIDALVDTSGNVSAMNVLSGPPSLRDPAMFALREYKYVPATRNGVPVPAHVTVRIQFHFE